MVKELKRCGVEVAVTSNAGDGFPDLVCAWRGVNLLVEVKDPDKVPSQRKLTPDQDKFHTRWKLHGPVIVALRSEDVIQAFRDVTRGERCSRQ